jgi:hypothetical protein
MAEAVSLEMVNQWIAELKRDYDALPVNDPRAVEIFEDLRLRVLSFAAGAANKRSKVIPKRPAGTMTEPVSDEFPMIDDRGCLRASGWW